MKGRTIKMIDYAKLNKAIFAKHRGLTLLDEQNRIRELTIDGPIGDPFNEMSPRILWVLRESDGGGGSSLIKEVNEDLIERDRPTWSNWYSTWGLIIKVSDAILNKLHAMRDAPPRTMKSILKNVAVINLNKFGGGANLSKHYRRGAVECKVIVDEQIEVLQPDIIIWAGTGSIATRLGIDNLKATEFSPNADAFPSIRQNNRIHISAYHTQQSRIVHRKYCKQIIEHLLDL
jgi:hypothetical protein